MSKDELTWIARALQWAAIGGGLAFVLFVQYRLFSRRARIARFAKRSGLRHEKELDVSAHELDDVACLRIGASGAATNAFAGERGGRQFVAFDWHYELPGNRSESRAYMPMALVGWFAWFLLPWIDAAAGPAFTIAIVRCPLGRGATGSELRTSLSPLRAEFAMNVSVIRSDNGLLAPEDVFAAVDRLNAVLDATPRQAARS